MKILFVINQLHTGGAEQQLVTLCRGLVKRGHQTEVISIYDHLDLRDDLDAVRVPVTVAHKYSKIDLSIILRLRRLIKKIEPDLVHAYLPASCLFTGMAKWVGVSTPVLQAERSVNFWKPKWRVRLDNLVRKKVAKITCNADAIRKYLIAVEGVPPAKVALIYNGIPSERCMRPDQHAVEMAKCQIGAPLQSFVVTAVANFIPVKEHHLLIRAFAEAKLKVSNLFLLLIGRGPLEHDIRKSMEKRGLIAASCIISNCTNPLPFLCASNAAVLTSSREGCSNAILESMAAGLPVVASDAGGNTELVLHGSGGFICRVGDVASVANALVCLAQAPSLCHDMGSYNARRVTRQFTDDIMTDQTVALYKQVLSENDPKAA
jgi:glycosyltransferase involved in cell wall biosynthesis